MPKSEYGTLQILPAERLDRLDRYQRIPSQSRISTMARKWDDEKVGILLVARIVDGEYEGRLHVYDGGTRLYCKKEEEPGFLFACWVKDMTTTQAARAFLAHNRESMRPSAFSRFKVGTAAGDEMALAIEAALAMVPLAPSPSKSVYGNGEMGEFAAFASAERIVRNAYAFHGGDGDAWERASEHLAWVICLGREAYPQAGATESAHGHDADIIQAISVVALRNPRILDSQPLREKLVHSLTTFKQAGESTEQGRKLNPLFGDGELMLPTRWRQALVQMRATMGGSSSRGAQMAGLIASNFNRLYPGTNLRVDP